MLGHSVYYADEHHADLTRAGIGSLCLCVDLSIGIDVPRVYPGLALVT